jgi:hypothetical protein
MIMEIFSGCLLPLPLHSNAKFDIYNEFQGFLNSSGLPKRLSMPLLPVLDRCPKSGVHFSSMRYFELITSIVFEKYDRFAICRYFNLLPVSSTFKESAVYLISHLFIMLPL